MHGKSWARGVSVATVVLSATLLLVSATQVHPAGATGAVSVGIVRPVAGAVVGDDVQVIASVQSDFALQSVVAQVEGRQVPLTFYGIAYPPFPNTWRGTLSLAGLTRGPKVLTVVATDTFGTSGQAQVGVFFDAPPALAVSSPLNGTVARPQVRLTASCSDDAACMSLRVLVPDGPVLAEATASLDVVVWLGAYDGQEMVLRFEARDSLGQLSWRDRSIYVDGSRHLVELDSVPGPILDVQPDRVLFLDQTPSPPVLGIQDRASGAITTVPSVAGTVPVYGYLTPAGAIFMASGADSADAGIYDWRGGTLLSLGSPNSTLSLVANGTYAIWSEDVGPCCGNTRIVRRDLLAGSNLVVADPAGNFENDVAANGDVAFWRNPEYQVYRYRNGTVQQLSNDPVLWSTYPVTDGTNVVYRKAPSCCAGPSSIVMNDGSGEVILTTSAPIDPEPHRDYEAEGGWVAFGQVDIGGASQIWTRSPAGVVAQRTFFGSSSTIAALNSTGEVMIVNGGRLYLSQPGTMMPADLGSDLGGRTHVASGKRPTGVFFQDGQWQEAIGRSLFRISLASLDVPGRPTAVSATPVEGAATVTWPPPVDAGGSAITSYTVTALNGGVPARSVTTPNGSATSATVGNLRNETAYTFTVMANSSNGTGPPSDPSLAATPRRRARISVFRPSSGAWFFQGRPTTIFGTTGDLSVPGDYDGGGKADIAVYRPSSGTWFVRGGATTAWGTPGDLPAPGDYDGDGKTDIAVFRPASGAWFVKNGAALLFGTDGDLPVPGDYDGDGKSDIAVFRPSTGAWFVNNGPAEVFGTRGDIPTPGDYDGDGKTDIAVFRPSAGAWFVKNVLAINFGANGDVPASGDYDADGKTDVAVFRPSTGAWFVRDGTTTVFGTNGDAPLPLPSAIRQAYFP